MTAPPRPDPYAILGVSTTVSDDDLDQAFRGLVRQHHPDTRAPQEAAADTDADRRLQEILTAYAMLRDPVRRAAYDRIRIRPATVNDTSPGRSQASARRVTVPRPLTEPAIRVGPVRWEPAPRDAPQG